jgi:5-carboxymethyl-2-hydroxymuconate isomerase
MPHVIVEYTDNLEPEAEISALLAMIAQRCAQTDGVLPLAGVRVRAIRLTEYAIADGRPEYGFMNITVKMGQGRDDSFKSEFFGDLFDKIKAHLAPLMTVRPVALSMYVEELDEAGAYRENGVRTALGLPAKISA